MKKKIVYIMLAAAVLCACTGCKKKEKVQQTETASETVKVQNETAEQKEDTKVTETAAQEESKIQEETKAEAAGSAEVTGNSAEDNMENIAEEEQTEQIEIGDEDSWEDSAEGWD